MLFRRVNVTFTLFISYSLYRRYTKQLSIVVKSLQFFDLLQSDTVVINLFVVPIICTPEQWMKAVSKLKSPAFLVEFKMKRILQLVPAVLMQLKSEVAVFKAKLKPRYLQLFPFYSINLSQK